MANQHEIMRALAQVASRPELMLALAALTVLNLAAAVFNVIAYLRNRRRLSRVQARERRLDAGPVTAAVGTFSRTAATSAAE